MKYIFLCNLKRIKHFLLIVLLNRSRSFQSTSKQVQRHRLPHPNLSQFPKSSEILGLHFSLFYGTEKKSAGKKVFASVNEVPL